MNKNVTTIYTGASTSGQNYSGWSFVQIKDDLTKTSYSGSEKTQDLDRLCIKAIIEGLYSVKNFPAQRIDVYTTSSFVSITLGADWLETWSRHGWRNVNSMDLRNADLWKELYNLIKSLNHLNISFKFISSGSINIFVRAVGEESLSAANQLKEECMNNVVNLFAPRQKPAKKPESDGTTDFTDIMKKNAENAARVQNEITGANRKVVRSHNLKTGDTPRSKNFKKPD
jgi:ribonuclease HI